jgi:hypothetical protein
MNENDFSKKLTGYLNDSATSISAPTAAKLHAARTKAMSAYREPIRVMGLMTVSGHVVEPAYLVRKPLFWLPILAIAATILTMQLTATPDDIYDASGALDAGLLTSELPVDAFLDNDFATWVKENQEKAGQ